MTNSARILFRVGLTSRLRGADGAVSIPSDLSPLERARVAWSFMAEQRGRELGPEHVRGYDGLLILGADVAENTLRGADRLISVASLGAGLDHIDLDACTTRGVVVTHTPDGAATPMAHGVLALLLALAHGVRRLDRIGQCPGWPGRRDHFAAGLIGRTVGLVGLGAIGREFARVAEPLGVRLLAYTPTLTQERATASGAELATLDVLLGESDFVCLVAPLTSETRGMLDRRRIGLMKRDAFLISVGRGALVDEHALADALTAGTVAGAAVDVLASEPLATGNPLVGLDNAILTPHAIGVTRQFFELSMSSCIRAISDVAHGRVPQYIANPVALEHPRVRERLAALAVKSGSRVR